MSSKATRGLWARWLTMVMVMMILLMVAATTITVTASIIVIATTIVITTAIKGREIGSSAGLAALRSSCRSEG
jgi:hypothetical protein